MDLLTLLSYVLAIVETVALVFALVFATKAMKAKTNEPVRKGYYRSTGICFGLYIVLNCLRLFFF